MVSTARAVSNAFSRDLANHATALYTEQIDQADEILHDPSGVAEKSHPGFVGDLGHIVDPIQPCILTALAEYLNESNRKKSPDKLSTDEKCDIQRLSMSRRYPIH